MSESEAGNDGPVRQSGLDTALSWLTVRRAVIGLVIVVIAGAVAGWALLQDSDLPEGAAFRVDGQVVDAQEIDTRIQGLKALYGVEVPTDSAGKDTFRRDTAKSLAVQLMLRSEAEDRGIVVADKEVSDTLATLIQQRYPDGGRAAFVEALGTMGASEEQVREEISDQLIVSRLFDSVVPPITLTDAEVRQAFQERRDALATPERRILRNIVLAAQPAAQQVLQRLRNGASFARVAEESSIDESTRDRGGRLGALSADQLESGYARAAFAVQAGDLFGPVKTKHGWNVGLVQRVVPPVPATYAEVRDALRTMVESERALSEWRSWLADVIQGHDVEYADDYRPADPDAVPDIRQPSPTDESR